VSVLAGPFAIFSALLAVGGALKAVDPGDTAHALGALGLPHARLLVRAGGAAETVVGVGALVVGGPVLAALVAASYLVFAVFVTVALRTGAPISSCGCFGKVDTPPSPVHVVVDVAAAAIALVVALAGDPVALPDVVRDQPLAGVPFVLLVVIGMYAVFLAFTALPKTLAAARAVRERRG
jgi:Methylamine utilisation protein MauE